MSNELQKRFRCVAQAAQKAHSHLKTRPLLPELKNLYLGAVVKSVDALSQLALAHGPKRINEAPKMQDLHEQEDEIAAWLSLLTLLMVERPEISSPKGPILSPLHYSTLNLLNIMVRDKEFTRGEVRSNLRAISFVAFSETPHTFPYTGTRLCSLGLFFSWTDCSSQRPTGLAAKYHKWCGGSGVCNGQGWGR